MATILSTLEIGVKVDLETGLPAPPAVAFVGRGNTRYVNCLLNEFKSSHLLRPFPR